MPFTSSEAVIQAFTDLDQVDQKWTNVNPSLTVAELPIYSLAMSTLRQSCEGMNAWSTLYRQCIMLREYAIAAVIQTLSKEEAPQTLQNEASLRDSEDWFVKLTCLSGRPAASTIPEILNYLQSVSVQNH